MYAGTSSWGGSETTWATDAVISIVNLTVGPNTTW